MTLAIEDESDLGEQTSALPERYHGRPERTSYLVYHKDSHIKLEMQVHSGDKEGSHFAYR